MNSSRNTNNARKLLILETLEMAVYKHGRSLLEILPCSYSYTSMSNTETILFQ